MTNENAKEEIVMLSVDKLDPNPFQARIEYPEDELRDLGNSMMERVIQPIVVRLNGDRYQVCTGWRRVLAARLVRILELPAIVRNLSEKQMAKDGLVENLKRKDLNVVEKARGYEAMQKTWGLTQEQVADELGLTRDQVAQALRVLTFPPELQKFVSHDTITQTHAEALARLKDSPNLLKEATKKVLDDHLTTNQTDQVVKDMLEEQQLHNDIKEFVTSEDFVSALMCRLPDYIDHKRCPLCEGPELQEYDDGLRCKRCGWKEASTEKLRELYDRIRDCRLKRSGIKSWPKVHNLSCTHSCTVETPHDPIIKT